EDGAYGSGRKLALEGRTKPGSHSNRAKPGAQIVRGGLNGAFDFGANVFEELVHDRAVLPLRPATDNAAVSPEARTAIARAVEQVWLVSTQEPRTLGVGHRRSVQSGQEGDPRLVDLDRLEILGQDHAFHLPEVHFRHVELVEGAFNVAQRQAGPPFEIGQGAWTK